MGDLMSQPGVKRVEPEHPTPAQWGLDYYDVLVAFGQARAKHKKFEDAVEAFARRFMLTYDTAEKWIRDARKVERTQDSGSVEEEGRRDVQQAGAGEGVLPQVPED